MITDVVVFMDELVKIRILHYLKSHQQIRAPAMSCLGTAHGDHALLHTYRFPGAKAKTLWQKQFSFYRYTKYENINKKLFTLRASR